DDDYPEITDSLLQVVYPQYLRPFPSVSIAQFEGGNDIAQLTGPARIGRGTAVHTRAVRGVTCRFRTAYDVDIWPLRLAGASYEDAFDVDGLGSGVAQAASAAIRLEFRTLSGSVGLDALKIGKL